MRHATITRRRFLGTLAAGGAGLAAGGGAMAGRREAAAQPGGQKTRHAAPRARRVIFNNDGDDIWAPGADTPEKFLALRHAPLLHTHVDSIFYCTTQSFNLFTHATRRAEVFTLREGPFADNNLAHFLAQGTDGLRMSAEFARQHGLESIWTLRMNDIHDAWTPQLLSQWKQEDPRRVMARPEAVEGLQDRRRLWSLVDFEHPEVEPRLLAIIEEVLQNYPIDGVELDWLRAPIYFRTHYDGGEVTDGQVELLTRLVANVRALVQRASQAQRRPLVLAVRVPWTTALCRRIGIDIAGWLEAGLVDLITLGGGYVVFDQPTELIERAHRHGVQAYVCLSQSGLYYRPPRGNGEPQPVEAWLGAAQRAWEAGADGIYTFNLFPGPGDAAQREYAQRILRTIGSLDALRAAPRLFAISDAGTHMPAHYWAKDAEDYSRGLPVSLSPNAPTHLKLAACGPLAGMRAELRLDFVADPDQPPPEVRLNHRPLGLPSRQEAVAAVHRFSWNVPEEVAQPGENLLELGTAPVGWQLVGAELWLVPA